jgi:hypothetical protein
LFGLGHQRGRCGSKAHTRSVHAATTHGPHCSGTSAGSAGSQRTDTLAHLRQILRETLTSGLGHAGHGLAENVQSRTARSRTSRTSTSPGSTRTSGTRTQQTGTKSGTAVGTKTCHQAFAEIASAKRLDAANTQADSGRHAQAKKTGSCCAASGSHEANADQRGEHFLKKARLRQTRIGVDGQRTPGRTRKRLEPSDFAGGHVNELGIRATALGCKVLGGKLQAHGCLAEKGLVESII